MRDPDRVGRAARAWQVKENRPNPPPDQKATLRAWLVTGPFHPAWSYWLVAVVHLRPIEGVRSPNLRYPRAQYEFMILSLSSPPAIPDIHPDPDDLETLKPLLPPDVIWQFDGCDDDVASRLPDLAVAAILGGHASPDSDWRSWWLSVLPKTLEHLVRGGHPAMWGTS